MEDDLSKNFAGAELESESSGSPSGRSKANPIYVSLCVILLAGVVVLGVLYVLSLRGGETKGYEKRWRTVMVEFQNRVEKDDKSAERYSENKDMTSLLRLANNRIEYFRDVIGRLLELTPPERYRKLHVLTAHYIFTLIDQLEAQKELNEALLEGKPTEDLSKIAESAKARAQQGLQELLIEMQKAGVTIETVEKKSKK